MYGIEMLVIITLLIFGFGLLYAVPMMLGARREAKREERASRTKTGKTRK